MSRSEIIRFLILRTIGNFLFLFAIFGVFATFGPSLYYEAQFRIMQARGVHYRVADSESPFVKLLQKDTYSGPARLPALGRSDGGQGFAAVLAGPKEQVLTPKDTEFGILIPKIGANAPVIANVDPTNESEYLQALQKGVAHAKGTVFPGMAGNIYLFAHSTDNFWDVGRYNAVFYLLKDVKKDDEIVIFFQNIRYNYIVYDTKIIDPNEVSVLVNSQKTGKEILILQTCWPPGTTWKRLLVFAKPKGG